MIKSISYDQSEIIHNILDLHAPEHKIDCDPTYSKGNFYKNTGVTPPEFKFDIEPQCDDVAYGDSRNLPLESESLHCIMFDPPFLATTGKSLIETANNNIINKYHQSEIRFIKGRLKFGDSKNSAPFPSMVVIFRPQKQL